MTAYFIGCNNVQGIEDEGATVATSTQSKDVEIQINGANVTDKLTAILLVEKLSSSSPPATARPEARAPGPRCSHGRHAQ